MLTFHLWNRHCQEQNNPYLGYLAWADGLIVTGESESMLGGSRQQPGTPLHIALHADETVASLP